MFKKLFGFGKKEENPVLENETALDEISEEILDDETKDDVDNLDDEPIEPQGEEAYLTEEDSDEAILDEIVEENIEDEEQIETEQEPSGDSLQEERLSEETQDNTHEVTQDNTHEVTQETQEVDTSIKETSVESPTEELSEDETETESKVELESENPDLPTEEDDETLSNEEQTEDESSELVDDEESEDGAKESEDDLQNDAVQNQSANEEDNLGFFAKLKKGLTSTTKNFTSKIESLFSGYTKVDDEIFDELEELLILADLGFETAIGITTELRNRSVEKKIEDVESLETELQNIIEEILVSAAEENQTQEDRYPKIMVVVGVNGVGKTTSIGKISMQLKNEGKSVMLAAGDTFRAAAAEQLSIWADRAGVPIIRSNEGADPSSVIFDAIQSAKAKNIDVLICDTAGRLHNKKNLMLELEKIFRIIDREYPEAQREVMLVIDATTGQNALTQAKTFSEVAPLTGIILTKLDGTAKGGVVIGLSKELKIPIKYVGVGEKIGDLQKFDARDFARALFSKSE